MVKVIFLENIEDHKAGDVKEVPDGYARNYLFKRQIAKIATPEEIKNLEADLGKLKKQEAEKIKEAEAISAKIQKMTLSLSEEVNEEGHLYGSVTNKELSAALSAKGFEIDPANIEIAEAIKELGNYEVNVKIGHGVETTLKVEIKRKD